MANANGSGDSTPPEDKPDPDRTQRFAAVQEVVDEWFPETATEPGRPFVVANETARRMNKQMAEGRPTTGRRERRGCWPVAILPAVAAVLVGWAVR